LVHFQFRFRLASCKLEIMRPSYRGQTSTQYPPRPTSYQFQNQYPDNGYYNGWSNNGQRGTAYTAKEQANRQQRTPTQNQQPANSNRNNIDARQLPPPRPRLAITAGTQPPGY